MIYDVDGWMIGKNPSPIGGGFTIINERNEIVCHEVTHPFITNNHTEILAIAGAAYLAGYNDIIRSDSQVALQWIANGMSRKRPDLNNLLKYINAQVQNKHLTLRWVPREENSAGLYNENRHSP